MNANAIVPSPLRQLQEGVSKTLEDKIGGDGTRATAAETQRAVDAAAQYIIDKGVNDADAFALMFDRGVSHSGLSAEVKHQVLQALFDARPGTDDASTAMGALKGRINHAFSHLDKKHDLARGGDRFNLWLGEMQENMQARKQLLDVLVNIASGPVKNLKGTANISGNRFSHNGEVRSKLETEGKYPANFTGQVSPDLIAETNHLMMTALLDAGIKHRKMLVLDDGAKHLDAIRITQDGRFKDTYFDTADGGIEKGGGWVRMRQVGPKAGQFSAKIPMESE